MRAIHSLADYLQKGAQLDIEDDGSGMPEPREPYYVLFPNQARVIARVVSVTDRKYTSVERSSKSTRISSGSKRRQRDRASNGARSMPASLSKVTPARRAIAVSWLMAGWSTQKP